MQHSLEQTVKQTVKHFLNNIMMREQETGDQTLALSQIALKTIISNLQKSPLNKYSIGQIGSLIRRCNSITIDNTESSQQTASKFKEAQTKLAHCWADVFKFIHDWRITYSQVHELKNILPPRDAKNLTIELRAWDKALIEIHNELHQNICPNYPQVLFRHEFPNRRFFESDIYTQRGERDVEKAKHRAAMWTKTIFLVYDTFASLAEKYKNDKEASKLNAVKIFLTTNQDDDEEHSDSSTLHSSDDDYDASVGTFTVTRKLAENFLGTKHKERSLYLTDSLMQTTANWLIEALDEKDRWQLSAIKREGDQLLFADSLEKLLFELKTDSAVRKDHSVNSVIAKAYSRRSAGYNIDLLIDTVVNVLNRTTANNNSATLVLTKLLGLLVANKSIINPSHLDKLFQSINTNIRIIRLFKLNHSIAYLF